MFALGAAAWLGVRDAPRAPSPTPGASATPTPSPPPTAAARSLALGITEPNPNFLWPAGREGAAPFDRWRESLARIRPAYYRLMVDWRVLQPTPDAPVDLSAHQSGCMRAERPCAGWAGVREQLRALAARQRDGGWDGMVVITGTPDWAAQPAGGCERPGTAPRSRRVRGEALPAYRRLVAALIAAAREEGARLTYWSPWNEPNHPYFLSPQRSECDRSAPSGAPVMYAELARAMLSELDAAEGDQRLVLGELAGLTEPTRHRTTVAEFIAGLPRDLVCRADVWGQHAYAGGADPVDEAATGLADQDCPRVPPIWITETGAGTPPAGAVGGADLRRRARGVRGARAAPRGLVRGPARGGRLPVHAPRGRPLPHRPRDHGPRAGADRPGAVGGVGRPRLARRPAAGRGLRRAVAAADRSPV